MLDLNLHVSADELENDVLTCNHHHSKYFHEPPGQEHYCLIRHIAKQYRNSLLVDIGTHVGLSALALSGSENDVLTVDVEDVTAQGPVLPPNVQKQIVNFAVDPEAFPLHASFAVLDIDPHDGIAERKMVEQILSRGWNGVMLCDDIHLNEGMEDFWRWVQTHDRLHAFDVTSVGHITGSGLVKFRPSFATQYFQAQG